MQLSLSFIFMEPFHIVTFLSEIKQIYPEVNFYTDYTIKNAFYTNYYRLITFNPSDVTKKEVEHYILHELGHYLLYRKCEVLILGIEAERLVEYFAWFIITDNAVEADTKSFSYYAVNFEHYPYIEYSKEQVSTAKNFLINEASKIKNHVSI